MAHGPLQAVGVDPLGHSAADPRERREAHVVEHHGAARALELGRPRQNVGGNPRIRVQPVHEHLKGIIVGLGSVAGEGGG